MSYKIAVASSDGKVINQHFGKATQFLIFEVDQVAYHFIERILTNPICQSGEHEEPSLLDTVQGLVGCRAVLASQIGKGAVQVLMESGIDAFEVKNLIEDALIERIKAYYIHDSSK